MKCEFEFLVEVAEAIIWNHEKNCYIGVFNSSDLIKAVILNGSRANPNAEKDDFMDYDIVFVVDKVLPMAVFPCFFVEFQLRSESKRRLLDCKPSTSLIDILRIMSEYRIRRLPVIDVREFRLGFDT